MKNNCVKSANPLITVLTVVLNDKQGLEETISSIRCQTYKELEYLIIDGGSTDGTVETIRNNEDFVSYWLSEPDDGIYYAMNKGIALAKGDLINFLNAGDVFYSESLVEMVAKEYNKNVEQLIVGDHAVRYRNGEVKFRSVSKLIERKRHFIMPFSHQSLFASSSLLKRHMFDTRYRYAADFEFLNYCFSNDVNLVYIEKCFSILSSAGVADTNRISVFKEKEHIVNTYFPENRVITFTYFYFIRVLERIKRKIKILISYDR